MVRSYIRAFDVSIFFLAHGREHGAAKKEQPGTQGVATPIMTLLRECPGNDHSLNLRVRLLSCRGARAPGWTPIAQKPDRFLVKALAICNCFGPFFFVGERELIQQGRVRSYAPDETVFRIGDEPTAGMFFVLRGEAGVYRDDFEGGRIPIARLAAGAAFGEMGLLLGEPRSATVRAIGDLRAVSISHDLLQRELQTNGRFLASLIRATLRRMLHLREMELLSARQVTWDLPESILRIIEGNRKKILQLREYLGNMRTLSIGPNHVVFKAGTKSDNRTYVVLSGEVRIFTGEEGTLEPNGSRLPGDMFGFLHLAGEPNRLFTARSGDQNTALLFLDQDLFYKVIRINPEYGLYLYKSLLTSMLIYYYNLMRARGKESAIT